MHPCHPSTGQRAQIVKQMSIATRHHAVDPNLLRHLIHTKQWQTELYLSHSSTRPQIRH